jgi:hypothetical protein
MLKMVSRQAGFFAQSAAVLPAKPTTAKVKGIMFFLTGFTFVVGYFSEKFYLP